jgi:GNAT superfamily N-acetyltransferase
LAVDQNHAGKGLGIALLKDAVLRSRLAAQHAASRGVFVQALDEEAAAFYLKFGFTRSPSQPLYLMLSLL